MTIRKTRAKSRFPLAPLFFGELDAEVSDVAGAEGFGVAGAKEDVPMPVTRAVGENLS
jgi:hypothetical protein